MTWSYMYKALKIPHTKKPLLELISKFVKVEGHEIKTQKSVVCLYTNNEQRKEEVKKQFCL